MVNFCIILFASFVAIFVGLKGLDANTSTAIRAVIMALFLILVIAVQGKFGNVSGIKKLFFILL